MYCYRISKYPRNNKESITQDWTAYSDIGKIFYGHKLTLDEYLKTEDNYVLCILNLLDLSNVKKMCITYLEPRSIEIPWKAGMFLSGNDLSCFIRDCLRENCWGVLECVSFRIEFGFDLYVHIGCRLSFTCIQNVTARYSLTVEEWDVLQSGIGLGIKQNALQIRKRISDMIGILRN